MLVAVALAAWWSRRRAGEPGERPSGLDAAELAAMSRY